MLEIKGNLWNVASHYDAIVVTTNGAVKKNGALVMGRGLAKQFAERYPQLPKEFGQLVSKHGNRPHWAYSHAGQPKLLSLPTQPHWKIKSTYDFVLQQCTLLQELVTKLNLERVLTVRPGCGLGGLDWTQLKPQLVKIWDDRFTVIS